MENVIAFPDPLDRLARRMGMDSAELVALGEGLAVYAKGKPERMKKLLALSIPVLRHMWDNVGDDSFYEGHVDCAEIWEALNIKGDGRYCAV